MARLKHGNRLARNIEFEIQNRQPRERSGETVFICPSHNDSKPSARWNGDKHVWYCDACGDGGGASNLWKKLAEDSWNKLGVKQP